MNLNANVYYIRENDNGLWLLSNVNIQNRRVYATFRRIGNNFEQTVSFHTLSDNQSIGPFQSVESLRRKS